MTASQQEEGAVANERLHSSGVAFAASAATIVSKSLLHPLDTLKCRIQIYSSLGGTWRSVRGSDGVSSVQSSSGAKQQVLPPPPQQQQPVSPLPSSYSSSSFSPKSVGRRLCDRCRAIAAGSRAQWRGIQQQYAGKWSPRYLYGGLPVKLVFYVPYQTVYLCTYDAAREALQVSAARQQAEDSAGDGGGSRHSSHSRLDYLWRTQLAAVAAELGSCVVRVPMETIKMRIQATAARDTGHAANQLWRNGWRACARLALPQTLLHDIPYSIIQWTTYETLRPWTQQWAKGSHESAPATAASTTITTSTASQGPLQQPAAPDGFWAQYGAELVRTFCSGGLSGLFASIVTVPLDNIRTRVVVATAAEPSLRVRDVVSHAYQMDGIRSFFRGGFMRVLWATSNMAVYFPLYELFRRVALQRQERLHHP